MVAKKNGDLCGKRKLGKISKSRDLSFGGIFEALLEVLGNLDALTMLIKFRVTRLFVHVEPWMRNRGSFKNDNGLMGRV